MNAPTLSDTSQTLGRQAKAASGVMAAASAAVKNQALRRLAALLRDNTQALQVDNARDLERASAPARGGTGSVLVLSQRARAALAGAGAPLLTQLI